jgi:hypothetical protein
MKRKLYTLIAALFLGACILSPVPARATSDAELCTGVAEIVAAIAHDRDRGASEQDELAVAATMTTDEHEQMELRRAADLVYGEWNTLDADQIKDLAYQRCMSNSGQ